MRRSSFRRSAPKTKVSNQTPVSQSLPKTTPTTKLPMVPIQKPVNFPKNLTSQNVVIIGDPNPPTQMTNIPINIPMKNLFIRATLSEKHVTGKETAPMVPRKFGRKNIIGENVVSDSIQNDIDKIRMNDLQGRMKNGDSFGKLSRESARENQMEMMRRKIEAQKSFPFEAAHTVKPQNAVLPTENLLVSSVIPKIVETPRINVSQIDTVKSDLDIVYSAFTTDLSKVSLDTPDTPLDTPDTSLDTPDIPLDTPDTSLDTPDIPLDTPDIPLDTPDIPLDTPDTSLDTPDTSLDTPDTSLDTPDTSLDTPDIPLDTPDTSLDTQ